MPSHWSRLYFRMPMPTARMAPVDVPTMRSNTSCSGRPSRASRCRSMCTMTRPRMPPPSIDSTRRPRPWMAGARSASRTCSFSPRTASMRTAIRRVASLVPRPQCGCASSTSIGSSPSARRTSTRFTRQNDRLDSASSAAWRDAGSPDCTSDCSCASSGAHMSAALTASEPAARPASTCSPHSCSSTLGAPSNSSIADPTSCAMRRCAVAGACCASSFIVLHACWTTTRLADSAISTSCCTAASSFAMSSQFALSSAMRPSAPASSGCCRLLRRNMSENSSESLWPRDMYDVEPTSTSHRVKPVSAMTRTLASDSDRSCVHGDISGRYSSGLPNSCRLRSAANARRSSTGLDSRLPSMLSSRSDEQLRSSAGMDVSRLWSAASTSKLLSADSSGGSTTSLLWLMRRMRSAVRLATSAGRVDRPQWLRLRLRSCTQSRSIDCAAQKLPKPSELFNFQTVVRSQRDSSASTIASGACPVDVKRDSCTHRSTG
mmetsp:Transcript_7319/g.22275  ORF Transcript_7319/g.22275 Transcript_7319/m.22275 type:complete len:490 (-) Transcript_7319:484-1953(-)